MIKKYKSLIWPTCLVGLCLSCATPDATSGSAADAKEEKGRKSVVRLSTLGDDIAFDKSSLKIPFAKSVEITFVNEAAEDSEIFHNVVVLRPGSMDGVIEKLQAVGYEMDQMKGHPDILAISRTLEPGKQDTITFEPTEKGLYPFVCTMPGHGDMLGMRGFIQVD